MSIETFNSKAEAIQFADTLAVPEDRAYLLNLLNARAPADGPCTVRISVIWTDNKGKHLGPFIVRSPDSLEVIRTDIQAAHTVELTRLRTGEAANLDEIARLRQVCEWYGADPDATEPPKPEPTAPLLTHDEDRS